MQTTRYLSRGISLVHFVSDEGTTPAPDACDTWKLIYIKQGHGNYTVRGKVYHPVKNDLIIVRAQEYHCLTVDPGVLYERYAIHFAKDLMISNVCELLPPELDVIHCGDHDRISGLFRKLHAYMEQFDGEIRQAMLIHITEEILCQVLLNCQKSDAESDYAENPVVTQAVQYINENICRQTRVDELLEHLHVSKGYLNRLFWQYMNTTPKRYITSQKLIMANRDLREGAKATEVCERYGFPDYSNFYRQFIQYFGYKPSDTGNQDDPIEEII